MQSGGARGLELRTAGLEGHPWPGCRSEETPGVHIVMDRPSYEGLDASCGMGSDSDGALQHRGGVC